MPEAIAGQSVYKNQSEIDFNEADHQYSVGGYILPSVTQIMRSLSDEHYKDISPKVLEKASERGRWVHKAVELFETLGLEAPTEIAEYLLQYKIAKTLNKWTVSTCESMFTNGQFCGTLDMMAWMPNGDFVIIDLKATSVINWDLIEVQLAGYKELAEYNGIQVNKCYCLHLKKTGQKFKEVIPNVVRWESLKDAYFKK